MGTWDKKERRQYIRIEKHFVVSYSVKDTGGKREDVSQVKNIGLGGICFISSKKYEPKTKMTVELRIPYVDETAVVEGTVLESHEKIPNMIYETRLAFSRLSETQNLILKRIVDTFLKIANKN